MTTAVGKPLERADGRKKITGAARYAAEFRPRRMAHAVLVQSTIARGSIESIDAAAARRLPGVLAVPTHRNAPKLHLSAYLGEGSSSAQSGGKLGEKLAPLAGTNVYFAGQNVALVVAETLEQAQHAAALVKVRYREDPPVLEIAEALATATQPSKAMGREAQHRRGDVEAALAAPGSVVVRQVYTVPVETNNPMEPSATVAEWICGRLEVQDSTQAVVATRNLLAEAFGLPRRDVRVYCPFTGGGFGCKGFQWPHTLLAAMAAKVTRRPVQLALTRAQMFTSVGHRPPTVHTIALAARRDGKLTAVSHETVNATSPLTEFVAPCGVVTSKVLYACDNVATPTKIVRVNVGAPTPMRAPAECPGTFAIESAMDELAYALDLDPLELRLRNHADRDPSDGKPWSSKHLKECYAQAAERFGWQRRRHAPRSMRDGELLVGWGMATAIYPGYRRPSSARLRLAADGSALVQAATQELGTGAYTIFTQVAADALGLPVERISFELGDSDFPDAPTSGGSCTTASVSEAIIQAAAALKARLAALVSSDPESPLATLSPEQLALANGRLVAAADPARGVALTDLLRHARLPAVAAEATVKPEDDKTKAYSIQSWGAMFCEVKIDPLLPRVRVSRFVSAIDVGRVLNPRTTRSQVLGGVTMGIGMALMEQTVYDSRTGRPVTDNFADYHIPVNADVESIEVELIDRPDPQINTLGCRGVGEIGITGVAAAVANAVYHATGRRIRDLPITPEKLL
ncbi:MAG: xanthine dehydrogenase family protein molybdopterin-binding subunit [Acidobacteria bacterium]|nr:xanthine dehydrogenase family protein molybdopterin-binding subunit [Acidobacteriota bacterium]